MNPRRKAPLGPAVVVIVGKGGDTKSTSTGAVADAAARAGRRVLAVDLDGQGTLTRWLSGVDPRHVAAQGLEVVDVLAGNRALGEAVLHVGDGLDLLAAVPELAELEVGDQREAMGTLITQAAGVYDLVVMDTAAWRPAGPSASLQLAALWHASLALLPMEPAAASVYNLREVTESVAEVGRQRRRALGVALLPTRLGAREADAAATVAVLAQQYPTLPPIRRSAYARRAMLAQQTLEAYAMDNTRARPLAEDYAAATAALLRLLAGDR